MIPQRRFDIERLPFGWVGCAASIVTGSDRNGWFAIVDQIGFTPNLFVERIGMYDLSAGGTFPHRLAGNIWESGGRPQRPAGTAGLRYYTLVLRSPEAIAETVSRVAIAGSEIERSGDAALVSDPSGNRVLLTVSDSVDERSRSTTKIDSSSSQ